MIVLINICRGIIDQVIWYKDTEVEEAQAEQVEQAKAYEDEGSDCYVALFHHGFPGRQMDSLGFLPELNFAEEDEDDGETDE
jgi:hypothetical protein